MINILRFKLIYKISEFSPVKCSLLIITLLALGTSIATCAPVNSTEETVELQIVALNDFHGQLEPPSGNLTLYYNTTNYPFKVELGERLTWPPRSRR